MWKQWTTPTVSVTHVSDLPPAWFAARKIHAVVSDLDNTLVAYREDAVTTEIMDWLRILKQQGIRICLASNTQRLRRLTMIAESLDVAYVPHNCRKPGTQGLKRALHLLDALPSESAMIGDQIFTDIVAGNRLGLTTILVNPLSSHEFFGTRLISRNLERLVIRRPTAPPTLAQWSASKEQE